MIVDILSKAGVYTARHSCFKSAFEFLRRADLAALAPGRYPIDGDRVFALVSDSEGKGKGAAKLEVHRTYIDIQYVASGTEVIGWKPLAGCTQSQGGFDAAKDIGFFEDTVETWATLGPGSFAVFFPGDAHAPLAGAGAVRKVVIKVMAGQ